MRVRRTKDSQQGESDEGPSVNLTPLIDVVFVVLIMFILIAPVLEIGDTAKLEIVAELLAPQGAPADVGGYYRPDVAKADAAMRPSAAFNATIDALR